MGILNNQKIITGVKPPKRNRPNLTQTDDSLLQTGLDKSKPLGPYNFPTYSYALYRLYGYRKDAAGLKHPVSWEEKLPTGKRVRFNKDDYPGITITGCERAVGGPRLI